jgi:hypothetical protein
MIDMVSSWHLPASGRFGIGRRRPAQPFEVIVIGGRRIVRVEEADRDEEGAYPDPVVAARVAHRRPPDSDRNVQLADKSARHSRPSEPGDVADH